MNVRNLSQTAVHTRARTGISTAVRVFFWPDDSVEVSASILDRSVEEGDEFVFERLVGTFRARSAGQLIAGGDSLRVELERLP